jgi:hypothetical protein
LKKLTFKIRSLTGFPTRDHATAQVSQVEPGNEACPAFVLTDGSGQGSSAKKILRY